MTLYVCSPGARNASHNASVSVRVMRVRTYDDFAQNMHFNCPRHLGPPPHLTSRKVQVTIGTNGSVTYTNPSPKTRMFLPQTSSSMTEKVMWVEVAQNWGTRIDAIEVQF